MTALYHRIRSRRGHQKAILAVAHQILTLIYNLLSKGEVYKELGSDYYDLQRKPEVTQKLTSRLQRLGYYVTLQPMPESDAPTAAGPGDDAHCAIDSAAIAEPSLVLEAAAPAVSIKRRIGRPCKCTLRGIECKH